MKTNEQGANSVLVVGFSEHSIPVFKENKAEGIVTYGDKNDYPLYLLGLFNKGTKHGAIVKGKAFYVAGGGWQKDEKDKGKQLPLANSFGETYDEVVKKCALDLELYNGFYLSVTWSNGGKTSDIAHVDYHTVRSDKKNEKFFVKEDWSTRRGDRTPYAAFDLENRTGTQILYYKEYRPGIDTYTLPDYVQALNYIEADILVSEHVLHNANCGFTSSKMIVLTNGEPDTDEAKKAVERGIHKKYTGTKGSKLMITFANGKDQAPLVLDLGSSDLTKEDFTRVDQLIQQNIFSSHNVTSPMLFGIKTEGQLGGSTELYTAYEIFKNTYVRSRQENLESVFGRLFEVNGIDKQKLAEVEPIGLTFSEGIISQNMTRDEIRAKAGLAPIETFEKSDTQKMVDLLLSLPNIVASKVVENLQPDELRSLIGLPPAPKPKPAPQPDPNNPDPNKPDPNKPDPNQAQQFTAQEDDDLLALFGAIGDDKDNYITLRKRRTFFSAADFTEDENDLQAAFAELKKIEAKVLDLVRKDPRVTEEVIAETLNISKKLAANTLLDLEDAGIIKVSTEKVGEDTQTVRKIIDEKVAKKETRALDKAVFIKYTYEGPQDDRNRPFCARLMELGKMYSRAEIESISERVGYSVWERRGGFYHNPKTDKTTPFCRHLWQQQIVIKKK